MANDNRQPEKRNKLITFKVYEHERDALNDRAAKLGIDRSDYIRMTLRKDCGLIDGSGISSN